MSIGSTPSLLAPPQAARLPRTAEGIAAAELRAAIVRGSLKPGEKILQVPAAEALGVSLVPLREALRTLAVEGIVTYHPQRGYFVAELPVERIRDLYVARETVEARAEKLAVPRLRPVDLETMRAQVRAQRSAVAERDPVAMIAANRTLHFTLFERCENVWLVRFVTQLWDALDPYRVLSYRRMWLASEDERLPDEIVGEHEAILDALDEGARPLALRLLGEHRQRSQAFLEALTPSAG